MAVRRLSAEQPATFAFSPENLAWAKAAIDKYPEGRQASAVIPILWRAQEQIGGWITEPAIRAVADLLGMTYIRVYEIATFYTMFQLGPVGRKAHVQVCGTTPCMLRGARDLIGVCRSHIAPHAHELSPNGDFSWEEVECLGSCANAPMVLIGSDTYEDLTPESFEAVLAAIARGRTPRPGSQIGRTASCPQGGATTLLDPSVYDGSFQAAWHARFAELEKGASAVPSASAAAAIAPAAKPAAPEQPAKPAIHPVAAVMIANAGLAPELERRGAGKPLPAGELEKLKASGVTGIGSGYVSAGVVLGSEEVGDVEKPPLFKAPQGGRRDDLKLIWGIGPKLEQALNDLGIYHFSQIAAWTKKNVKWIDQELADFRGRAERDKWIEQAAKLATGWRPDARVGDKPKG